MPGNCQNRGADPVGAVAVPGYADPVEPEHFAALEDAICGESTLAPAVVDTVRLHFLFGVALQSAVTNCRTLMPRKARESIAPRAAPPS